MSGAQTAIIPEAGSVALYAQLKVTGNAHHVLQQLQAMPTLVSELNKTQPDANVAMSIAFSHNFWSQLEQAMPSELIPFPELKTGNIEAPSTDVDVLLHLHSNRHDLHFYLLRKLLTKINDDVVVVDETYGYRYLDSRDMTDFIDGTENPKLEQRSEVALIANGEHAGGSYVMVQRFEHDLPAWHQLSVAAQEKIIGRTKADSIELDDVSATSHVGRVDIKEQGKGLKIVRHSLPYGSCSGAHGLLFIAYCHTLHNHKTMLESMYGVKDGETDQLLRFTKAVTGAYFFAPSALMLSQLNMC